MYIPLRDQGIHLSVPCTHILTIPHMHTLPEEYQLEGGEQIVEFKVKEKQTFTNISSEKCFSLDFPPGLVHLDRDSQSTPGQTWEAIKTLLATKKKSRQ